MYGKCLGYSGEPCPKCGRVRLERYEDGHDVCEKCMWSPQENRYVTDEDIFGDEDRKEWELAHTFKN